jgi:integrase/recombinase XerD
MNTIANFRISSPLPEVLFEDECTKLMTTASTDPRTYLLFLLFLETGIKLEELFALKVSHFDFSNKYSPEMYIKHTGKKEKKSRKLKLPMEIPTVFNDYVERYKVDDSLFPYTQRFVRYLITETAEKAGVKKRVSAQILRDTCAVRQLKRGEGIEKVLQRLGLSETTWEDAKEKYLKLSKGGYNKQLFIWISPSIILPLLKIKKVSTLLFYDVSNITILDLHQDLYFFLSKKLTRIPFL